ncbi:Eco57I restriction-modification methylase domain-containing protein [Ruegeria sp. HKCCD7318]|uniref:Eco57I restriction-modification methylase domain-containing protein n=1 Tax=Ruegeria sp. HKCCD7318 TaxID=2683014 RepID=UPI0014919059|nr:N-6 DNA methylase [Ruegeria sp. HKCCD7318]NOE36223.1 N-6 DNA methylase [Ruegeria sp. HKCCD7318]
MQHFTQNLAGSQPVFITQRQLPDDENACNSARFSELRKQLVAATRRFQPKQSQGLAQDVVFRVIDKWWAWEERKNRTDAGLRYPDTPIPNHGVMDDPVIYACVRQYAELAVATSAPMVAFHIGLLYTALLPKEIQTRQGMFFTPPALAKKLVEMSRKAGADWSTARVLEPSCGSGVVLVTALDEILHSMKDFFPPLLYSQLESRIQAYDADPFCAWMSQIMVDAILLPHFNDCDDYLPELVWCSDTLGLEEETKFDLIIGNPPFGKTKLSRAQKETFGRSVFGHPNKYGLFLDHAVANTSDSGVICFVTPTSYMSGHSFKNLRTLLRSEARPHSVCFLDQRSGVFDGVIQALALSSFAKSHSKGDICVEQVHVTPNGGLDVTELGTFQLPEEMAAPWLLPRQFEHVSLISSATELPCRIKDWGYDIKTGPMIWSRYKKRLSNRPSETSYPLIWSEAVRSEGQFEWAAKRKNGQRWCKLEKGEDHLLQSAPCVLVQRTTSPEQPRRLNAALLPQSFLEGHRAVIIENHLNVLYPTTDKTAVSLEVLNAFLNSGVMDLLLRCLSGSCAVSVAELHALPLPCPSSMERLQVLVGRGASQIDIEAECWRIFTGEPTGSNWLPSIIED